MNAKTAIYGIAAGAAGTAVLNASTYADMTIRARPASKVPRRVVKEAARRGGIRRLPRARMQGLSMLLGYADGFGTGMLFGMLRPRMRAVPWYLAAAGIAAYTLVLSEGLAVAMGTTQPRKWGPSGWLTDIVPRLLYGGVTCLVYDALAEEEE
jgi:hypothetical protein